ncbi:MAG: hypothetical protein DWQ30_20210 [Acidobacteria bacterium]|nr:MAG: hypothetical protein DWQ30_20210 [Acidobacteriota bacterium]
MGESPDRRRGERRRRALRIGASRRTLALVLVISGAVACLERSPLQEVGGCLRLQWSRQDRPLTFDRAYFGGMSLQKEWGYTNYRGILLDLDSVLGEHAARFDEPALSLAPDPPSTSSCLYDAEFDLVSCRVVTESLTGTRTMLVYVFAGELEQAEAMLETVERVLETEVLGCESGGRR